MIKKVKSIQKKTLKYLYISTESVIKTRQYLGQTCT